ncbi:MAG TPA: hypothetical protein VF438_02930 [Candidatus Paceibacterota bacterium]
MLARTRSSKQRAARLGLAPRSGAAGGTSGTRHSNSFAQRRRRRAIIGIVATIAAFAAWTFCLSRISFLESLQINAVDAYGDEMLATPMRLATMNALDGAYIGLFSRANAFLYSKSAVIKAVASTSPRINSVAVARTGLRTLSVTVSEKAPEAVICADLPDVTDSDIPMGKNCYLADADAYLYKTVDDPDAANYMRYYLPELTAANALGTQATTTTQFKRLGALVASIEKAGIHVHAMLVQRGGIYELYADNPDGNSIVVIQMNERANLETEYNNLVAFWNHMVSDAHAAGKKIGWSEIKTQFPPNVYSRAIDVKEEESPEETTEHPNQ